MEPKDRAETFARLGRDLLSDPEVEPTLQRVVDQAVELVTACDFSGLTLRRRRDKVITAASSSPVAAECDNLQYELDQGPCLQAVRHQDSYLSNDVANDERWPIWGRKAAGLGVRSVLAIKLSTPEEPLGALNFYSRSLDAFDDDDVDMALIFVSHAAMAMNSARLVTGLRTALASRHLIGVAQGILVKRYDLTVDQSFEVLRRYSSHANVKLRDVAERVVEVRGIPEDLRAPFARDLTGADGDEEPAGAS